MTDFIALSMIFIVCATLLLGFPIAFVLPGIALFFAFLGSAFQLFDTSFLQFIPARLFGLVTNNNLIAIPLFILMGVILEQSKLAEKCLHEVSLLFSKLPGGLCIAVTLVGALLAACTGIVGATVVTMTLIALPALQQRKVSTQLAVGTIAATGTLGQIIPPSIALVLLGDVLSSAYQESQLQQGIFNPKTVSVGDLFAGALLPGLLLVSLYILYIFMVSPSRTEYSHQTKSNFYHLLSSLLPAVILVILVLGSILAGFATPTEAAGIGALGSLLLAKHNVGLSIKQCHEAAVKTMSLTAMIFFILIGASIFSLVFRGFGGDELVSHFLSNLPGGSSVALSCVMLIIFLLGFILDFIEITFIVIPIVSPTLFNMGYDPIWLGILFALNLQTSFLTPPFGFAIFYLQGAAKHIPVKDIYWGVAPFIIIQCLAMLIIILLPMLATWLPAIIYA